MLCLLLSIFSATTPIPVITSSAPHPTMEGNKQEPSSSGAWIRSPLLLKALLWVPTIGGRHPKSLPQTPKQACHDPALANPSVLIVPCAATVTLLRHTGPFMARVLLCLVPGPCYSRSSLSKTVLSRIFRRLDPSPSFGFWSNLPSSERLSRTTRPEALPSHSPSHPCLFHWLYFHNSYFSYSFTCLCLPLLCAL